MNDFYIRPLSSDLIILLYLKCLFNEVSICKHILNYKKQIEYDDTMYYHINRWENIAGEYLYMKSHHKNNFSYILNARIYKVKKDIRFDFFNITGISYQNVDMLHELIKLNTYDKKWLKYDDDLYTILSIKIMNVMKPKKRKYIRYSEPI